MMRGAIFILGLGFVGLGLAQSGADFAGTWVLKFGGQPIFKLVLTTAGGHVSGSLTKPSKLTIDQDGDATEVGPQQITLPVQSAEEKDGRLILKIDGDRFVMTVEGRDRAWLAIQHAGMRPWRLERASEPVTLATQLPVPEYTPEIRALREQLRSMVKEDQEARLAFDEARMHAVDTRNRTEVLRILDHYGWVTGSLAGKEAAHNFWLLVQHQTPEIQQRALPPLEKAAKSGEASMTDYAYLYDRVQVGLGKPQHWGTQADCVKGKPVISPVDDLAGLDARRRELFLPTMREYLKTDYLVKACRRHGK